MYKMFDAYIIRSFVTEKSDRKVTFGHFVEHYINEDSSWKEYRSSSSSDKLDKLRFRDLINYMQNKLALAFSPLTRSKILNRHGSYRPL